LVSLPTIHALKMEDMLVHRVFTRVKMNRTLGRLVPVTFLGTVVSVVKTLCG